MSSEANDYLSPCFSLPNIMSYLNYDEVVRCMQVNKTINNSIDRNWNRMQRKRIYLNVESFQVKKDIEHIITITFGGNHRMDSPYELSIYKRNWEYSSNLSMPPFLKELLERNSVPDKCFNDRLLACFVMKPEIDGMEVFLKALLPRVVITTMKTHLPHESETIKQMLTHLSRIYLKKQNKAVLTVRNSHYRPVYIEIAKAIGAAKMELSYYADMCFCPLTAIDTATMKIFVHEYYVQTERNNTQQRVIELLEARLMWNQLCDEMGVSSKERSKREGRCSKKRSRSEGRSHLFFQLRRAFDESRLDISYYTDKRVLYIEQLF